MAHPHATDPSIPDSPPPVGGAGAATRADPQPRMGDGYPATKPPRGGLISLLRQALGAMFASKAVRIAMVVSVIGLGLWVYAAITKPDGAEAAGLSEAASGLTSGLASGLAGTSGPDAPTSVERTKRAIDSSAPAMFRFGFSFVVGFFAGWCLRQVLKVTLLVTGAIATLVIAGEKLGITSIDWSAVQTTAAHSVAWVKGEGEMFGKFVTGYVPSAVTAAGGGFWGFRRR